MELTEILQFIGNHPILTFFLVMILAEMICVILSRFFRYLNIRKNGWPPQHCDADGDFKIDQ